MFGLETVRNLLRGNNENQRTDTVLDLKNVFGESNLLQPNITLHGGNNLFEGVEDYTINAGDVYDMCTRDSYFPSLIEKAREAIFVKGGYFEANKRRSGELEDLFKRFDIEGTLRKIFEYEIADGGGNWVAFPDSRGILRVEPFWAEGKPRAKVYGDDNLREVTKVEIINHSHGNRTPIFTIDTTQRNRFIKLGRYNEGGNYMFSSNPAKRAVFWYILKKYIGGANLMAFKNGLQEPTIISPAYDKLAKMAEAFAGSNKVGGGSNLTSLFSQDPMKSFDKNLDLTIAALRKEGLGISNTNKTIFLNTPVDIEKVGRDNTSMQTIPLRDVCNQEISFALGIGRGILDAENLKFNNAEQLKDNLVDLMAEPYQRKFEKLVNELFLPFYDPSFVSRGEKYVFGKEVGDEDIKIYEAKTERIDKQADIIGKLNGTPYKLNLKTMEIEEVELPTAAILPEEKELPKTGTKPQTAKEAQLEKEETETEEQITEKKTKQRADTEEKPKSLTEQVLSKNKFAKFRSSVETILTKQLKSYTEKLSKYEDLKEAINNFNRDFKPVSSYGLGVQQMKTQLLMFARNGVESVQNELGRKRDAGEDFDFPMEILEIIDIQSQILVKGWDSLGTNQIEVAEQFFSIFKKTEKKEAYKGLDFATGEKLLSILRSGLTEEIGIENVVKNIVEKIPEITKNQATLIAETEAARALQTARFVEYKSEGAKWKKWSTVKDELVRETHTDNEAQGWIPFGQPFANGNMTSGVEPRDRCDVSFSLSVEKPA